MYSMLQDSSRDFFSSSSQQKKQTIHTKYVALSTLAVTFALRLAHSEVQFTDLHPLRHLLVRDACADLLQIK